MKAASATGMAFNLEKRMSNPNRTTIAEKSLALVLHSAVSLRGSGLNRKEMTKEDINVALIARGFSAITGGINTIQMKEIHAFINTNLHKIASADLIKRGTGQRLEITIL